MTPPATDYSTVYVDGARWGHDPTLQLHDDTFTELPDKSEFAYASLCLR